LGAINKKFTIDLVMICRTSFEVLPNSVRIISSGMGYEFPVSRSELNPRYSGLLNNGRLFGAPGSNFS